MARLYLLQHCQVQILDLARPESNASSVPESCFEKPTSHGMGLGSRERGEPCFFLPGCWIARYEDRELEPVSIRAAMRKMSMPRCASLLGFPQMVLSHDSPETLCSEVQRVLVCFKELWIAIGMKEISILSQSSQAA